MQEATDGAIPPQLIEDALERVLASRGFRGSARKSRFLKFVVQETQAGHADRIKAFTIAMDVFDRDASFDPLLDPVVRIQAGRIRRCLEQYYLTDGAEDPVQITIPKGGYVPHFAINRSVGTDGRLDEVGRQDAVALPKDGGLPSMQAPSHAPRTELSAIQPLQPHQNPRTPQAPAAGLPGAGRWLAFAVIGLVVACVVLISVWFSAATPWWNRQGTPMASMRGPSLLVLPFANGTGNPAHDVFAEGFTEDLIGALIRFRSVFVFGADTTFQYRTEPELRRAEPGAAVDYVLRGNIGQSGDQIQISVSLMSTKDKRYIWSSSYRGNYVPSHMIDVRQDIAAQLAQTLAQPQGVIYKEEVQASALRSPHELSSYECVLRARQYWRRLSLELHAQVRTCLERAIRNDPLYADAWAALGMVYVDEARLGFNPVEARPDPVSVGLDLATHAVSLAPDNPLSHRAVGFAHWLRREPEASIAAYETALQLNPNDSEVLADLGRCYSFTGNWERGIPLLREAFARNPAQPGWYRIVFALYHYVHGRYDQALMEAQGLELRDVVLAHVALAMIYGQTGRKTEAVQEVGEILRLDPRYSEKAVAELERRNIHPAIIGKIVDGLQKAGLPVSPQTASVQGR